MAKSALQKKLEERAANEERFRASLAKGTKEALAKEAENQVGFDNIVNTVRNMGIVEPIREIDTFSRSLKTSDNGKIAMAVAQHLFGKYKVPQYLTNAWNFVIKEKTRASNAVEAWHRRNRRVGVQNNISRREIENYCAWYSVAASGGSLWKEHTRSYMKRKTWTDEYGKYHDKHVEVPMFTKKENHAFLNCPLKEANVREAVIYAIASQHGINIGNITRLCKSKLATMEIPSFNPVEFYTRRIWRETIHFFAENEVTISELNDLLDYIQHALEANAEYSLKGRHLQSLKKNMQDWHWELNRVKRMGNADWSSIALPIPNEEFTLPAFPNMTWFMNQIVTSKELAAEGTSMHHCVYSYQASCSSGKTAVWSLKRKVEKKGWHAGVDRCLTIEMNVQNGALVQIRGFANRMAHNDEMAAVRYWAGKHNFSFNRY